jgi:RimJ/RimL family protein N-acetyltransferase
MLIFELDIKNAPDEVEVKTKVEISPLNMTDLDSLLIDKRPSFKSTMLERLEKGDLCFVAKRDEEICGYQWQRPKSQHFGEIDYEVKMDDKSVWIYGSHIFEKERGKRILHKLILEQFKLCKDMGYERAYCGILSTNKPSLRSFYRFGFKKVVKKIKMVKILGITRHNVIDCKEELYE